LISAPEMGMPPVQSVTSVRGPYLPLGDPLPYP